MLSKTANWLLLSWTEPWFLSQTEGGYTADLNKQFAFTPPKCPFTVYQTRVQCQKNGWEQITASVFFPLALVFSNQNIEEN